MKKTFVLLLALCMAAVLFAVPAFAEGEESTLPAEAGITDESGLNEALKNAQSGSTVTLGADITLTAPVTVLKGVTLDGAGHALTANFDSIDNDNTTSAVVYANGSVKNLTVDAASRVKYAVQAYGEGTEAELAGVAMNNGLYSGLLVNNGAKVKTDASCTFTGNHFSDIELANGTPELTMEALADGVTVRFDGAQTSALKGLEAVKLLTAENKGGQTVLATNSEASLEAMCNNANMEITKVTLGGGVKLTKTLNVTQPIALDGAGYALEALDALGKNHVVNVTAGGVSLKNVTVDASGVAKYAVHVYNVENVTLEKVTAVNGLYNGVLVNGSTVTMKDMTFKGNGGENTDRGGIELGKGSGVAGVPKVMLQGTFISDRVEHVISVDLEQVSKEEVKNAVNSADSNLAIKVNEDGTVTASDKNAQPDPKPEEKPQDKPSAPAPAAPAPAKANPKTGVKA